MIKRFTFILCFILTSILSPAITYYVSSTGNDNNNGTSASTPWRTISKVNSRTLVAGDVILFERGGNYRGSLYINQSGTPASPITVSAYGNGNLPVFLGSQLTSNWVVYQGNIWKTQVSATRMAHLFYNDSILPIARFPNTGWLRNDVGSSTQINDSQLNQPAGYWNGVTVVVRSTAWSYDTARVTSYSPGVINMTSIVYNLSNYNWGYFLRNKLELLDAPGEWFFDRSTSTLYLYPITSNPNSSTIEVVTAFQAGDGCGISVNWQRSNVVIENIAFKHYGYAGVSTSGSNNVTVRNCTFDQCDDGIRAYGNGQTFSNNMLTRCRQIGINSIYGGGSPAYGNNNLIENNTITDCAIYPGLGKSNWGYFGLNCTGFNNIVRGNRLTRIGYIALSFSGNCLVENNVIDNACYILSDGSGIAFDNTDGAIVRNNIVLSTLGNIESCATNFTGCDPKGKGIYFGNISNKNDIIEGNTVAYCNGAGIWFDHTMVQTGNKIRNNTLFGNNLYQFGASDYSNYNGPGATSPYAVSVYPNQSVTDNIFYSNSQSQKTMYHINRWFSGVDFADFNSNKYVNPWDTVSIQVWNIAGTGTNLDYSLSQWRGVRGDDLLSTNQPYLPQSTSNDHILVYNTATTTQTIGLPAGTWRDLDGQIYESSIQLNSLKSKPLYKSAAPAQPPTLALKVWLQGPFNGTNMNDNLRSANLIPLSDPYPGLGYVHVGSSGATTTSAVLSVTGNNAIIDWILVEVRSAITPTQRLYTVAALLQKDGDIVSTNGTSSLSIPLVAGNYHIAVRHRNHLGVMTASPVNLTVGTTLNFSTAATWGTAAMNTVNGINVLWAGDASFDGVLKYTGSNNDRDFLLNRIGGTTPTNIVTGYHQEDINLSGSTIYTGAGNDRDIILFNIGGTVPTNTRSSQLP
jgi:parallel beta-helix repeat protein